jgi:hypothetical protein
LYGARVMSEMFKSDLRDSLGAGDTELDTFLSAVGLATIVGNNQLPFHGLIDTVKLNNSFELGLLLFRAAELADEKTHG